MSELYKVFDESGLTTLTNHMKVTRNATDANIIDIENLGNDLAGLAEAVAAELEGKQDTLTFDTTPTEGSTNPVTSGGILQYINDNAGGIPIVTATSTDGVTYTATVPGMDSLVVGKEFVIIPDTASTVINPKLNVNGLGDKYLRCPIGTNNATTTTAASANWIYAGKPISVRWNGSFWITDIFRADANNLYGIVPIEKGGTGASDAATARANLGITLESLLPSADDGSDKFLRIDGEWAEIEVPSHTQAASTITAGTFAGAVKAASANTSDYYVRNIKFSDTAETPTNEGDICFKLK